MTYASWSDATGTVHAAEEGNLVYAVCGLPLEDVLPDQSHVPWESGDAPAGLCERCRSQLTAPPV